MRPPIPTEAFEQAAVVSWLDYAGLLYCHVPNGGHRSWKTAKSMKKLGVKPGVPDLLIFTPPPRRPDCIGTAIEMKRQKRGVISDDQNAWLCELDKLGWHVMVCAGCDDALRSLIRLGYRVK